MEEVKLHKQKVIETDHVINLIDRKYHNKPCKELPKGILTSKSVPNGDYSHTKYQQKAEYNECPAYGFCSVKQFLIP
ncbi:MAG: hypothetical protein K5686_07225, partial [Lachnospiraceae bacterium]|nr:hypothetical protein [Lachnospiraceae bacterium]